MNRPKIRLIAYDIDGTLIREGTNTVPSENASALRMAAEAGILLCPATGRAYTSISSLLGKLMEGSFCMCMNGAAVYGPQGETICTRPIETALAESIRQRILASGRYEIVLGGDNMQYLHDPSEELLHKLRDGLGERLTLLREGELVPEPMIKITAFCPDSAIAFPELYDGFQGQVNAAIAGKTWVDFTVSDKGTGVLDLCNALGVSPEETAAIGDNFNDEAMLEAVGYPFLMENAVPVLREKYPCHVPSVAEAVRRILEWNAG